VNPKPSATRPQSTPVAPATDPAPERRTWRGWMTGETWEALSHCRPFPGPIGLARAYRERFGRSPYGGWPGQPLSYTRAEVLELAAWLQERQAAAATVRRGAGQ
jgi:hypothetical protein